MTRDSSFFKLFLNDVGLLASLYMDGIQLKIHAGETDINFGAVYENFVAQELHAGGFPLYYFSSRKVGEVDSFVLRRFSTFCKNIPRGKDCIG